jgi:hypothetical protein
MGQLTMGCCSVGLVFKRNQIHSIKEEEEQQYITEIIHRQIPTLQMTHAIFWT